jgi:4-hydroxy-L-threonine phosphate dehydrogenase PdxA
MIGITLGDPAGIGPEITLKALTAFQNPHSAIRIIGSLAILENLSRKLKLKLDLEPLVFDVIPSFKYQFGKTDKRCGISALKALDIAVELLKAGKINGIVTAPICKDSLRLAGFKYPGHTEFLADTFKVKKYAMLAYSPNLKIAFVTIHKPLREVAKEITPKKVLEKILLLNDFLAKEKVAAGFSLRDKTRRNLKVATTSGLKIRNSKLEIRIAVLAFNPHSFEFSAGEEEKIAKAINKARRLGIKVLGPFPADTINELIGKYDGLVAMYHDQGMIPVKLLARDQGVNITLGLPYPRTSPLHGCAFDIAGQGIANPASMQTAIELCLKLTPNLSLDA